RAVLRFHAGDWRGTIELIDEFDGSAFPGTSHYMESIALDLRARLSIARDEIDDALEATAREVEVSRAIADPQALLVSLGTRVTCLREGERIDEAAPLVDEVLSAWSSAEALSGMVAALDLAWILRAMGRGGE